MQAFFCLFIYARELFSANIYLSIFTRLFLFPYECRYPRAVCVCVCKII